MRARGRVRFSDLDELKRPTYLAGIVIGLPVIVLTAVQEWDDPVVRVSYPALTVVLALVGVGLAWRRLSVARAELVVLTLVPMLWFGRLVGVLYLDPDLDAARDVVTVSIGPGLSILVVIIYLAVEARAALRASVTLTLTFAAIVAPRALSAVADPAASQDALALVRMVVYTAVISLLLYVLATLKEQVTRHRERAADLDVLAGTDMVTGITNRRRAEETLLSRLVEADRYERPLAVALLDLDEFKTINDALGHAAGDDALRRVVAALQAQLRQVDTLARWGGDELLVIAPETTLAEALGSAERWRRAVADLGIRAGQAQVTVSIGVTERQPGDTLETVVARADAAMYEAKTGGRDRTVPA